MEDKIAESSQSGGNEKWIYEAEDRGYWAGIEEKEDLRES